MNPTARDDLLPRIAAAAATAVLLALSARLLLDAPRGSAPAPAEQPARLRLAFVPRDPGPAAAAVAPATPAPAPAAAADARSGPASRIPAPASAPAPAPRRGPSARALVYDAEGRVRLPEDDEWETAQAPARAPGVGAPPEPARDPLQRENPVDYRGTRFEGAWTTDGDLADVTAQQIARAQKKLAELMLGKDIQHAQARPSPEVRYNPARHGRPSDLGSEATGDAWRAAPIDYQPAPGLDGEASRRIRAQVAELERGLGGCDPARVRRLMAPVLQGLEDLQRAERAYARGADPIRREHQLPNAANSAWDQARRALWYAGEQLAGCRR